MRETIQFFQHEPARRSSGQVGSKRRKATCNEVCIYKVHHTCFLREKFFCKGGLARTIGSRDHNATRGFRGLLSHVSMTKTGVLPFVAQSPADYPSLRLKNKALTPFTLTPRFRRGRLNPLPSRERTFYPLPLPGAGEEDLRRGCYGEGPRLFFSVLALGGAFPCPITPPLRGSRRSRAVRRRLRRGVSSPRKPLVWRPSLLPPPVRLRAAPLFHRLPLKGGVMQRRDPNLLLSHRGRGKRGREEENL